MIVRERCTVNPLRLGIVGCGAVTETLHLPALKRSPGWAQALLVDADRTRAERLAASFGGTAAGHHSDLIGRVDAALVAVSNAHHANVSIDLLEQGIHVLVEKPMALTTADCDRMSAAAARSGATLAVGLGRRFFTAYRFVKQCIDRGVLGEIRGFEFREGGVFNWPVATDAPFRREAGGGVLRDVGPHTLDLLLWWLGDVAEVACLDDAAGGVDANCELHLTMQRGCRGVVEFSRTRNFPRYYRIEGSSATFEVSADWNNPSVSLLPGGPLRLDAPVQSAVLPQYAYADVIVEQWDEFGAAIREKREPYIPGREGRRAIELIERCQRVRQPLPMPWRDAE
jgi:predicted dehydrogenase